MSSQPPASRTQARKAAVKLITVDLKALVTLIVSTKASKIKKTWEVAALIRQSLMLDIDESANADILESCLWKDFMYPSIKKLQQSNKPQHTQELQLYLAQSFRYFVELLQSLWSVYHFDPIAASFWPPLPLRAELSERRLGVVRSQASLVLRCLADVVRYQAASLGCEAVNDPPTMMPPLLLSLPDLASVSWKEHLGQATGCFLLCRRLYAAACRLTPKNGILFSLVGKSIYHGYSARGFGEVKLLAAAFFYARALTLSAPFLSAKDGLVPVFETVRHLLSKLESKADKPKIESKQFRSGEPLPKPPREIWFSSKNQLLNPQLKESRTTVDGPQSAENVDGEDETEIERESLDVVIAKHAKALMAVESSDEQKTKLTLSMIRYGLHLCGVIFTRIAFEQFEATLQQFQQTVNQLVQYRCVSLNSLLQLLVVTLFVTEDAFSREPTASAMLFGSCGLAILSALCTPLWLTYLSTASSSYRFVNMMPTADEFPDNGIESPLYMSGTACQNILSIAISWLTANKDRWQVCYVNTPATGVVRSNLSGMYLFWQLACLHLNQHRDEPLSLDNDSLHRPLWEDVVLRGMRSQKLLLHLPDFNLPLSEQANEIGYARLTASLRQLLPQHDDRFVWSPYKCGVVLDPDVGRLHMEDDDNVEGKTETSVSSFNPISGVILEEDEVVAQLANEKRRLVEQKAQFENKQQAIETVISGAKQQTPGVLEVRVKRCVIDTNCFLSHLDIIHRIVAARICTVTVPLVVVNELSGLSKGGKDNGMDHHRVAAAEIALAFVDTNLAARALEVVTRRCTVIPSLAFRDEDIHADDRGLTNDDAILKCCEIFDQSYHHDPEPEGVIRRYCVLLTADRNLKLRASTVNIPTKTAPAFASLMGVT